MTSASRVLVLFAHPALHKSRVNRRLAAAARELDAVTFHDLYEEYPDLHIDLEREQKLLLAHEVIVFQHPFYWYSSPAILKEWQDVVLTHGFAYGAGGTALHRKKMLSAITTGGPAESYLSQGLNHFTISALLAPFEQTARLCGMEYLPPFVIHNTHQITDHEIAHHCHAWVRLITDLSAGAPHAAHL